MITPGQPPKGQGLVLALVKQSLDTIADHAPSCNDPADPQERTEQKNDFHDFSLLESVQLALLLVPLESAQTGNVGAQTDVALAVLNGELMVQTLVDAPDCIPIVELIGLTLRIESGHVNSHARPDHGLKLASPAVAVRLDAQFVKVRRVFYSGGVPIQCHQISRFHACFVMLRSYTTTRPT